MPGTTPCRFALLAIAATTACGTSSRPDAGPDAGTSVADARVTGPDAMAPSPDAAAGVDAAAPGPDAAAPSPDGAVKPDAAAGVDAAAPSPDAGVAGPDATAGSPDAATGNPDAAAPGPDAGSPGADAGPTGFAWLAPTTNANGTPLQDLAGYKLHYDATGRGGDASHVYANVVDIGMPVCTSVPGGLECRYDPHDLVGASGKLYFTLTAYDGADNESAYSNEVSATGLGTSRFAAALPQSTTKPKLLSQDEIAAIAADPADWSDRKSWCDGHLGQLIGPGYVGWDWHDAIVAFSTCYQVAKHLGLPAQTYADKTLALMRVMARDQVYGTPSSGQELVGVGDGATKSFALRMAPAAGATVKVTLAALTEKPFIYSGTTTSLCGDYCFDAIVRISNSAGGPPAYVRSVDYHESYPTKLRWLTANHPAGGATFYALVADGAFAAVSAGNVSVSGTTLTLAAAPTSKQAVFVEYLGPAYAQTGNAMGGVESIRPDSYYPMRSMNVGLAWAFDSMRESADLTPALRAEYAALLAEQVDAYMETTGQNPYLSDPLSNYFIEGELTGAVCSAFAIDDDVTTTPHGRVLVDLARDLITQAYTALDTHIPGGFGFEGTYTNGAATDLLKVFSIWRNATGEDLASQLQWTANLVPAIIHGIKPDRATFYDGGDWNELPAVPLTGALRSFVHYQADHPMAPFARQALADVGEPVAGATRDYKSGPDAFPLSFLTKGTGALYARSDWGTGAVWMSMSVGPVFSLGHEHLDRGHVTIQRGADYLLKDAGDYGAYDTVPWHNTLGFGSGDTPSQCGGDDDGQVAPPRYLDGGDFVYGQEDLTKSYCKGVSGAVRTVVYLRPGLLVVHDRMQTSDAATRKQLNLNFGGDIAAAGSVFSTVVGGSKLFMRSLVPANPSPTITPEGTPITGANGTFELKGTNYRVSTSGQTADTFLHVFEATSSGQAEMAATTYLESADARAQGAAIDAGETSWVVLSSTSGAELSGTLAYALPVTCPCAHVIGDLPPSTSYSVAVYADADGAPIQTLTLATGPQGVLSFATPAPGASRVTLTAGGTVGDMTPPTVTLTAPASGATVSGTITLAATAADVGTGVTEVQFLVDGAQVAADVTAPYTSSYATTGLGNGAHTFAARALDGAGHSTTSAAVTATVSNGGADTLAPAAPQNLRIR